MKKENAGWNSVTAPLYIGDEARKKNMCIVAFLLNAFSQAIGITVAKKDFVRSQQLCKSTRR